jgi:hypothetical protein
MEIPNNFNVFKNFFGGIILELMKKFEEIIKLIDNARNNALKKVNEELITLYWKVGQYISQNASSTTWGDSFVDQLANFIKNNYPQIKGFNRWGLYRMKQFYDTYRDNEFVSPLVTQNS